MRTETDTQTAVTGSDAAAIAYQPESCPPPPSVRTLIAGASDVYKALEDIRGADREHLLVFDLNVRHRVLQRRTVHIGTLTGLECHPREVFKPAIIASAAAIVLAHNHPSNDASPSRADIDLTHRLREAGDLLGIPLLDHVIVCAEGYVSLAERNWR